MPHVLVTNTMTVYLLTLFYHIMYSTITCKTIMHLRLYTIAPILCFLVIFYNSATLGPTNVETLSLSGALLREWLICSNIFTESSFFVASSLGHFFHCSTLCMFLLSACVQGRYTIYYGEVLLPSAALVIWSGV
jgi:hypothetical protein